MQTLSTKLKSFRSRYFSPRVKAKDEALMKENFLDSPSFTSLDDEEVTKGNAGPKWIIGIIPHLFGALALLKIDDTGSCSAEVSDTPHLQYSVKKNVNTTYDEKSMVELIRNLHVPSGTMAYIEEPSYSDDEIAYDNGFGYGLWTGILLASHISVTFVDASEWNKHFKLKVYSATKKSRRKLASELFPSLSPKFVRKTDHGRAEALLVAAYGSSYKCN